jgi:hypothetical protein
MRRDAHMREILDDGFAQLDGAQPSVITAEFDKPELPRSVETDSGQELPEIGYFDDHTAPQTVLVPRRNRHSFMAVGRPSPTRATAAARSAPIAPSRGAHARKPVNVRGRESFRIAALGTANLGQARSSSREMAARRKEKTSPPIAAKSSLRLAHETRAGAAPRGKPASSSPKGHATNRDAGKRGRR